MDINIIEKNEGYIIVEKPVGMPSQPDKTGAEDLLTALEREFGRVWLLHRLDRPVGGIMVFALSEAAAAFIGRQINDGRFKKEYLAVGCGVAEGENIRLTDYLVKNQRLNSSVIAQRNQKNAKEAVLEYTALKAENTEEFGTLSLLRVKLFTGRHHQIRVQLANAGLPLWGDTKYNEKFKRGFHNVSPALYSTMLEFVSPITKKPVKYEKKPEFMPFSLF